ncbi:hypothetical protein PMZ80_002272 [Knufia obscura]|uniref:Chitin deacetylase n=2 Tax=Knufia TaxID=430999 RepID=A0AAN8I5P3_9EURO|nr:hypothetical protein PMZ80_002272 [Knufia obscura]KAK5950631.1 hypothetical protein OHC33_008297 [Knufia fluminis]
MHKTILLAVLAALTKISSAHEAAQLVAVDPPTAESPANTVLVTEMRCGKPFKDLKCPQGMCCSSAGYCGTSEDYCFVPKNCQEEYGWCDSKITPTGASVSDGKRTYNNDIPALVNKCTKPKTLALSFDDGPTEHTHKVLDVLKSHNAHAAFFLGGVFNKHGQLDKDWVPIVRRMVTEGHQIGSHTWSHPKLDNLNSAQRKDEMHKVERAIANIIGKIPTFMRPPMIICNNDCQKDMRDLGYHVANWEIDSEDWVTPLKTDHHIIHDVLIPAMDRAGPNGSLFTIQHDTRANTAKIVDALLTHMHEKKDGWAAVPLVECLGHDLDDAYQFPKYLEYNGAAKGGCLVSGPDMCVEPVAFKTSNGCFDAYSRVDAEWRRCKTNQGFTKAHCLQAEKLAADMQKFCFDCGDKHKPACDWNAFKSKNL